MMNRKIAFLCSILLAGTYIAYFAISSHWFYPVHGYRVQTRAIQENLLYAGRDQTENTRQLRTLLPGETININTADADALQRLPGIGPALSEQIIHHRETEGFYLRPEDLMRVPGIGEKTFSIIRDFIRVGGNS